MLTFLVFQLVCHLFLFHIVNILSKNIRLNPLVKSVLGDYIRFVECDSNDSNKSRWSTSFWWQEYLENLEKIDLSVISIEHSITKKRAWLDRSVSKSQLLVYLSTLDIQKNVIMIVMSITLL